MMNEAPVHKQFMGLNATVILGPGLLPEVNGNYCGTSLDPVLLPLVI